MPKAVRTRRADEDLIEIGLYIAQDSLPAARRVLAKIERHCETLARSPEIGRKRDDLIPGIRSMPVYNYMIYYQIIDAGIQIIRVLHGSRDQDAILGV